MFTPVAVLPVPLFLLSLTWVVVLLLDAGLFASL
jgi:hypothetical protein